MNEAEQEAINLCIASDALRDIVNHQLLELSPVAEGHSSVTFASRVHQELFLIRLLDFCSEQTEARLTGFGGSCLSLLAQACGTRSFGSEASIDRLAAPTFRLQAWLREATHIGPWLPSLNLQLRAQVPRQELVFLAGNLAKHNAARLTRASNRFARLLADHGHEVSLPQVVLAIDDLAELLNEDYFAYYCAWISQQFNDVLWGIYHYLLPTYATVYRDLSEEKDGKYGVDYPEGIVDPIAREWFWRLMNSVRALPPIRPFSVAPYMQAPHIFRDEREAPLPTN